MEVGGCPLPEDRLYDVEEGIWVRTGPSGQPWTLGLTSWQVAFAGRFLTVSFRPDAGTTGRGRSVATVESARCTGPVRLPVEAVVLERNERLAAQPRLMNDSPYDEGWIVRFRPTGSDGAPGPLEPAAAIRDRLQRRIEELRIRCYPAVPDVELYEIGTECSATLAKLDEELARRSAGEVVLLVTDDATSPVELVRWSDRTGQRILGHRAEDGLHHFLIRKEDAPVPRARGRSTGVIGGA